MSLTEAEQKTLELSAAWWNSLHDLNPSEQDWREFQVLFHAIQDKVLARPARRERDEQLNQLLRKVCAEKKMEIERRKQEAQQ